MRIQAKPLSPFIVSQGKIPHFTSHKTQRPSERKDMTVVLGFLTGDGVIIASDSREVANDYSKSSIQKIHHTTFFKNWGMAIAGATNDSSYLKLFESELSFRLAEVKTFESGKIISIIRGTLHQIHKQHLWPRKDSRPSFDCIIALYGINPQVGRCLFVTHDSAVVPVQEYASIGIGSHMADYLKSLAYPQVADIYNSSTSQIANFAVYMLQHIKRSVHGVDGETSALIIRDGAPKWMTKAEIRSLEVMADIFHSSELSVFLTLLDPSKTTDDINKAIESFRAQVGLFKWSK